MLIVTAGEDAETLLQAVAAGAAGYVTKRSSPEEVRQAVMTVHGGGSVITPMLAAHLLREFERDSDSEGARPLLTDEEREIFDSLRSSRRTARPRRNGDQETGSGPRFALGYGRWPIRRSGRTEPLRRLRNWTVKRLARLWNAIRRRWP